LLRHPFALHDDLIDAASRIYDIDPQAADVHEAQSTKPLEVDYTDIAEGDVLL